MILHTRKTQLRFARSVHAGGICHFAASSRTLFHYVFFAFLLVSTTHLPRISLIIVTQNLIFQLKNKIGNHRVRSAVQATISLYSFEIKYTTRTVVSAESMPTKRTRGPMITYIEYAIDVETTRIFIFIAERKTTTIEASFHTLLLWTLL